MIEEGSHRHLCKIVDRRTSNGFQLENLEEAVDHAGRGAIAGADSEDSVDPGITRRCLEDRIGTEIIRRRIDILALINPLENVRGAASYAFVGHSDMRTVGCFQYEFDVEECAAI